MSQYQLEDLLQLMRELRHPEHGCPWDLKQSYRSIVPHTLEEAYEVADAIENSDRENLQKELGDLLFQVIFYARLGEEENSFDFHQIVNALVEKLLRRHPHVFPEGTLASAGMFDKKQSREQPLREQQINENWERIKGQERRSRRLDSLIDDVPTALPALSRAVKLQKRVAQVGFDWSDYRQVMGKVAEELTEVKDAVAGKEDEKVEEELGDLLFTCVNLSRHLSVDPETALRKSCHKFERRFRQLEQHTLNQGREVSELTAAEMESGWERVKTLESVSE